MVTNKYRIYKAMIWLERRLSMLFVARKGDDIRGRGFAVPENAEG